MEQLSPKGVEPETILISQPDQIVIDTAEVGRIIGKTIADEETTEIPPDKRGDARHHAVEGKDGRPEVDLAGDPLNMARAIGVRRAKRLVRPDEQRHEKTAALPLDVRRPNRFMTTVITQYEDDSVVKQTISLQSCEEAFKLEVEVAKRRDVAVSVMLQSLHLRMPQGNGERMVHAGGERGEEKRSSASLQGGDPRSHEVEKSAIRETRSEEHTSELQSLAYLVCRLLLEKKKKKQT